MAEHTVTIRSADARDVSRICRAESEIFSSPWSETSVTSALADPIYTVLIAESDGTFCGYLTASVCAGEAELQRIAVLPERRRSGTAKKLIEEFLRTCRDAALDEVYLEVRTSNAAAISLYQSHGFSEYALRHAYYTMPTEDALLMKCVLCI